MKKRKLKNQIRNLFGIILIIVGIFVFLSPNLSAYLQQRDADQEIEAFETKKKIPKEEDPLYQESLKYNQKIYQEGQIGLKDVWSYKTAPIKLKNEKKSFGYIKIKKMSVRLPLYLGATTENMRKGAAIMGETSLPLGMKNGNCVIAAHRGYQGIPYFREIERLKVGDSVVIKNPWEKLNYKVEDIKVIEPDDLNQIKIQEGKDMITLLTCHPYRGHGKYRYVVYCVRDHGQKMAKQKTNPNFKSSQWDIQREKMFRLIGGLFLAIVILFVACSM